MLIIDGQSYPLTVENISDQYADLNIDSNLSGHYQGSLTASPDSWLRLSTYDNTLYGLGSIQQKLFYIEQDLIQGELPLPIYANKYTDEGASKKLAQAAGPEVNLNGDTAGIDELPVTALPAFNPKALLDRLQPAAEEGPAPARILNIEFIFDPGTIALRGYAEVEKVLAATNLLAGYYQAQADLIMNLSALHFPTADDNPIIGGGQAFEIITDMANDRVSGDLDIAGDSVALFITARPIMSQAGAHNGFAMLDSACTTAANTVISDRVVSAGAPGGPAIPNAPLDFLYLVEILAHEIGHILGGRHTACNGEGGIMQTFFAFSPRSQFSSCSLNEFEAYLDTAGSCVLDYQTLTPGFDGTWFDPQHDGEGFQIQILAPERALVAWYSYTANGEQRWFSGVGVIQGNRIVIDQLSIASGAEFGENFDPASVQRETWGSAIITFDSCDSGLITYLELATGVAGAQILSRLTSLNGLPCDAGTGQATGNDFNASGTWFDPSHDGEGLIVEQLDSETLIFSWFSYDNQGRQAWFADVALRQQDGSYLADSVSLPRGGIFGSQFDPATVVREHWGSLRLSFNSCDDALLEYASSLPAYGSGHQNLIRLSMPLGIVCTATEQTRQ